MSLARVLRTAKLTLPTPLMGVTPLAPPLPSRPRQIGGTGVPLLPSRMICFLRPSPPPPPGRSDTYRARVLGLKQLGSPVTGSLSSTVSRVGVPVPLRHSYPPRAQAATQMGVRFYSSEKNGQEIFKSKLENFNAWKETVENFNAWKETVKMYSGKAVKVSGHHLKQVLKKILLTVKEVLDVIFHHVVQGMKAKVNEYTFHLFVLGLIGTAKLVNMVLRKRTEGYDYDSELEKLDKHMAELFEEFPQKISLGLVYLQVSYKMLKEVILARKKLEADIWKRFEILHHRINQVENEFETLNQRLTEVDDENHMLKDCFLETQMKLKGLTSDAEDLKQALTKLKASSDSN